MLKKNPDSLELYDNLMLIKRKLAYTYWLLGDEYIDHALNISNEITTLFMNKSSGSESDKSLEATLYNNLCWYELEKWQSLMKEHLGSDIPVSIDVATDNSTETNPLIEKIDKHEHLAHVYFEKLHQFIEEKELAGENVSSNWLDTAAWYCFLRFKKYADDVDKNLAVDLAKRCDSGINYATLSLTSLSIHLNHLTEILSIAESN